MKKVRLEVRKPEKNEMKSNMQKRIYIEKVKRDREERKAKIEKTLLVRYQETMKN